MRSPSRRSSAGWTRRGASRRRSGSTAPRGSTSALGRYLYHEGHGRFARTGSRDGEGYLLDTTVDASLFGLVAFGALEASDPRVRRTLESVRERLWVRTPVGGIARYENDYYHQVSKDLANVPGNPWIICTLWLAQYEIAEAGDAAALERALRMMRWVAERALPSGVLAEQVHPHEGTPLSVSPLTWSHATLVATVLQWAERRRQLESLERRAA